MNAGTTRRLVGLATFALLASLAQGCGAMRKNLAANMGVKVKTKSIQMKNLGNKYQKLQKTEWNFFSKKRYKKDALKITYKHFGVKAIDDFNRQSAELYAQYEFARRSLKKSRADTKKYLKKDIRKLNSKELGRALNKNNKNEIKMVRRFKEVKNNLKLALDSTKSIIGKSSKMTKTGERLATKTPGEMTKDPARAIYADEAVKEVYKSIKRLGKVAKGGPGLVSDLTSFYKLFAAVF